METRNPQVDTSERYRIGDEFLDTADLARLTKTKPQTWRRRRWTGDSPRFVKLGNRVLYRRSDVDRWLAERTFRSTTEATARARG